MANCEQFEGLISKEIDEELTEEERRTLLAHIAGCPDCRELSEAMNKVTELLSEELTEAPPELLNGIRYQLSLERRGRHFREWRFTAIAAVICLVVFGALKLAPAVERKSAEPPMMMAADVGGAGETEEDCAACEVAPAEEEGTELFTVTESKTLRGTGTDEAELCVEPAEAKNFFYTAQERSGYSYYEAVENREEYYAVYIVYDRLPEQLSDLEAVKDNLAEGIEEWVITAEQCRQVEEDCLADEIYFENMTQDKGLVIVIDTGVDNYGND